MPRRCSATVSSRSDSNRRGRSRSTGRRGPGDPCVRAAPPRTEPSAAPGGSMTAIAGYVFDAYGTLFDVHSVIEAGRDITADPLALSTLWRQKQLEYTWLRSLMDRYQDFWAVTEAALRYAVRRLDLLASEAQIGR